MKVAFWSTVHGQTATTSNLLAISIMIALKQTLKTLITHNHYYHSTLEHTLLDPSYKDLELTEFSDMGIDAVSRFIKFNTVDESCIKNYATTIIKNRLDFLTGTKQANASFFYKDINHVIELVINAAQSAYDLLLVDVASGENEVSNKILTSADLVVINLNQSRYVLDDFFGNHAQNFEQAIYLISLYDSNSKYNLNTIKRKYKIKDNVAVIPYSRNFADALNDGTVIEFFARNLKSDKKDSNYNFIRQIEKAANMILSQMNRANPISELKEIS